MARIPKTMPMIDRIIPAMAIGFADSSMVPLFTFAIVSRQSVIA